MTTYTSIETLLRKHGPMRSSRLADLLASKHGIANGAARQQITRSRGGAVLRLTKRVLPKNEAFLYYDDDWNTDRYWQSLVAAMREAGSVYGMAIDGLIARGGIAQLPSFKVVTGAPVAQKRQVPAEGVVARLVDIGVIWMRDIGDFGPCVEFRPDFFSALPESRFRAHVLAENVLLDALHQWARNLGLGSYNSIDIRGADKSPQFSTFLFDLCGPSYLMPLATRVHEDRKPGFLVADVFFGKTLTLDNVQYFLRKVTMLKSMRKVVPFLPILLADGYTKEALRAGKGAGVIMATTRNLFGEAIASALATLTDTLERAASIAAANPDRVCELLDSLQSIEGSAGNLRGALFELVVAFLVKEVEGNSVDIGEIVRDPKTGKAAEIDVRRIKEKQECWFYECRGRLPTNQISVEEVETWIDRVNRILNFHRAEPRFQGAKFGFELWTTGSFHPDAVSRLEAEKAKRSKITIKWRDGPQVREYAKQAGRKSILDTLDTHYLTHPLAD